MYLEPLLVNWIILHTYQALQGEIAISRKHEGGVSSAESYWDTLVNVHAELMWPSVKMCFLLLRVLCFLSALLAILPCFCIFHNFKCLTNKNVILTHTYISFDFIINIRQVV